MFGWRLASYLLEGPAVRHPELHFIRLERLFNRFHQLVLTNELKPEIDQA